MVLGVPIVNSGFRCPNSEHFRVSLNEIILR